MKSYSGNNQRFKVRSHPAGSIPTNSTAKQIQIIGNTSIQNYAYKVTLAIHNKGG